MLASISPPDLLALRRVFHKRHVCIHAGGEITDQYVRMIPEDKSLLGTRATLTLDELELAAKAMRCALADLVRKIEAPGR